MKKILISSVLLASFPLMARMPKVKCDLMTWKVNRIGATVEGSESNIYGITINASTKPVDRAGVNFQSNMEQICASNGKHCTDTYRLISTLEIGDSYTTTITNISKDTPEYTRQHLTLAVGKKMAAVNCDKN